MLVALLCGCNNSSTREDEKSAVGKHPTRHGYGELPIDVLYGDIDSICQIRYKLTDRFGTTEEEIDGYKFIRFNEDGNVVEDVNYDKNLNISFRYIYDYNSKGHPRTMTICSANDVVIQQKIYTIDNMGNITSETSYGNDGLMDEKRVMKYEEGFKNWCESFRNCCWFCFGHSCFALCCNTGLGCGTDDKRHSDRGYAANTIRLYTCNQADSLYRYPQRK